MTRVLWRWLIIVISNDKQLRTHADRFGPSMETSISSVPPQSVDIEMQPHTDRDIIVQSHISHHDLAVI